MQLTLKGDAKPASQNMCQYGPGGQVQKTPMSPPPPPPSGGRLKQKVIADKKAEMQDYMGDVKTLLAMYVLPDPQKMEQAYQSGKVSLNPAVGMMNLIFKDYAQPGDQMTLTFDTAAKKIASLTVNTYIGQSIDAVTLQVQMASLPDGTNYTEQTVLNASAKQLVVTTTNSGYQNSAVSALSWTRPNEQVHRRRGVERGNRSRPNTVADVRTGSQLYFETDTHDLGFLAYRDFRELRAIRASRCNRYDRFVRRWVSSFWRDLFDPGDVCALRGID